MLISEYLLRAILLLALGVGSVAALAEPGDYLPPELRARVEKLKADLPSTPSNATNVAERARVLWDWANAHAQSGGTLPVNLTQAITAVFAYADLMSGKETAIDGHIREMILLDEAPQALGRLVADPGPFEAGAYVSVNQTFTVGSRSIQPGGGFLLARHFLANYGRWQAKDPKADNYVSIRSSNRRVKFVADTFPVTGMHGGFRGAQDQLVFRLASGSLIPGDVVTITYGDRSQSSRGFRMANVSSDRMPLPIYLAFNSFDQDGHFYTLPIQPVRVTGSSIAGVHGFAPSVIKVNEPFDLFVRAQDAYYNRARDGHPDWLITLNGEDFTEIPAGPEPISVLEDVRLSEPGVYRFGIASADGLLRGDANPILVEALPSRRIFWGDTHGHSGFAEGIGTPEAFLTWARDDARLDFVTHSEHDIWLDDAEWDVLRNTTQAFTDDEFIAFLGYEWTVRNIQGGHHNVLFRTPDGRRRIDAREHPTLSSLYHGLRTTNRTRDVLVIPHAHQAGDYRQSDPELETLVEIMSQHGNFEWFGRLYLSHGHRVGFTAASDNHLSQPGYSAPRGGSLAQRGGLGAVLAQEKTPDALFDAMKTLAAYATTGDRIILDVDLNGQGIGQRAAMATDRVLRGRVIGTAPIASVTVVKNDVVLWTQQYLDAGNSSIEGRQRLLLSFGSDSKPLNPGDNPRGWRLWRGTITVDNADLISASGQDFDNLDRQTLSIDPNNPKLIHFNTQSRGDTSSIVLELDNVKRTTELLMRLEAAGETGGAPPLYRPPQQLPPAELSFALRDLASGRLTHNLHGVGYEDRIQLRRFVDTRDAAERSDVRFEVRDSGTVQGDYYFVRVVQVDDAMAWSSPIWVGGHRSR